MIAKGLVRGLYRIELYDILIHGKNAIFDLSKISFPF